LYIWIISSSYCANEDKQIWITRNYISDVQKVGPEIIIGKSHGVGFGYDASERAEESTVYLFEYFNWLYGRHCTICFRTNNKLTAQTGVLENILKILIQLESNVYKKMTN